MFLFGFQTPCSEYAQALVDFHHYIFFFLVVIVIFVVGLLKFSLLFVVSERNLSFVRSQRFTDFNVEERNIGLKRGGELDYLLNLIKYYSFEYIIRPEVREFCSYFFRLLPTYYIYIKNVYIALYNRKYFYRSSVVNFPGGVFNNRYYSLNLSHIVQLPSFFLLSTFFLNSRYKEVLLHINVVESSFFRGSFGFFETPFSYQRIEELLLMESVSEISVKTIETASFVSFYVVAQLSGYAAKATRFSHGEHVGSIKPVFLFFNGIGENYYLDRSDLAAFDLNCYLPQAFGFVQFYKLDLWHNPFLFFQNVRHRLVLEWVGTFIPTFILLVIVVPSLYLLYSYDRPYVTAPYLTFKAIGHQWYWSYEYFDYIHNEGGVVAFDSYMIHEDDLELGQLRLLEVDRRVVLPTGVCIRMLTTSSDVLHSGAVPALGVKLDAVPGRLNQFWLVLNKPGVFYGQCSEICGVNHGFMPIAIEAVFLDQYLDFILMYNE